MNEPILTQTGTSGQGHETDKFGDSRSKFKVTQGGGVTGQEDCLVSVV